MYPFKTVTYMAKMVIFEDVLSCETCANTFRILEHTLVHFGLVSVCVLFSVDAAQLRWPVSH